MTQDHAEQTARLAAAGRAALAARRHAEAESLLRRAVALNPADARLHNDLGRVLNNLRRHNEAEAAFRNSIGLAPDDAATYCNLGHVLRAQGQLDAARSAFAEASRLDPGLARAWRGLATTQALRGDLVEATAGFRRALEAQPGDIDTLLNLAGVLESRGLLRDAATVCEQACDSAPDNAHAHGHLANVWQSLGNFDGARIHYELALSIDPADQVALAGAAFLHERRGEYEQGWQLLADIVEHGRAGPDALHAAARLLRRRGQPSQALALLRPLQLDPAHGWSRRPQLYFTLGEIHDDTGAYAEAFRCFQKANALSPPTGFDPDPHRRRVDQLIGFFGSDQAASSGVAAVAQPPLIFIVGMPRSGTSLVEQILASHPLVQPGGERPDMPRVAHRLAQRGLAGLSAADLSVEAQRYRDSYGEIAAGIRYATDKLPVNFLELGLIERLFPNARVVHCERHPLDVIVSIFFQNFHPDSLPFATKLEHIAVYYEQYERLMAHWRNTLRLPMLDLRYERLVGSQEPVTRELLAFLDLPWDARCLRFFETSRDVSTSSYAQVRQPIYRSSVRRFERYLPYLGDLAGRFGRVRGSGNDG